MKILMLCDSMDCGGAETHILTLSAALVTQGHDVCVASRGGGLVRALCKAGVRHITLPFSASSPISMLSCRIALSHLLSKEAFDIVHSHSRLTAFLAQGIAKRRGIAFAVTAHAYFSLSPLRRRLSRWGNAAIAVSEDIKQYLVKSYSLLPERITVIPNGVDEKLFYPSPLRRGVTHSPRIAFLSRLDEDCSLGAYLLCDIAEEFAQKYPNSSVIIGGAGSEIKSVSQKANEVNRRLGREFIKCAGEVKNTAEFFRSADIFVGVSRAAIEAGMTALPVILCGNEGFLGRLSPENFELAAASNFTARKESEANADILKKELLRLLSQGEEEIFEESKKVRALFLDSYSLQSFVKRTEEVYKRAEGLPRAHRADTLLCGYYGYSNIGDDALLSASLRRAKLEYPNESVALMTKNGRKDSSRFGARCIKRTSPFSVIFAISRCKRLIFGGGTLLQSSTSRRSLLYYSALLIVAGSLKKECILWANGIELPHGAFCRKFLRAALKNCSYIGARDTRSLAIAKELSGSTSVFYEDDLAVSQFVCQRDPKRINYLLGTAFKELPERFVIAVPRAKANSSDIALLIKALSNERKNKNEILTVPMCPSEDREICLEICRDLGAKMLDGVCFDDLVGLARHCNRFYSMRYHGLVAASLANAEAIGIGNDEKISVYCKEKQIKQLGTERES